jgi:hypothetical protein
MPVLFRNELNACPTKPVLAHLFITKQKSEVNVMRKKCIGHLMFPQILYFGGSTTGLYPV